MEEIKTGVIFFVGCFIVFLFFISGLPTEDSNNPRVIIEYAPNVDRYFCSPYGKGKIKPDWGKELARKFPKFEAFWNRIGPNILMKTSELTGKHFVFSEKKAYLFMCPSLSAFTIPLMIPITEFVQEQNKVNEVILVDSIFHNVLHLFVASALFPGYYTPQIGQHFHESWATLTHLHLFALQKAVYLNTNQQYLWFQVKDRTKDPDLIRAINIVETTGTQPFIDELK